MNSVHDVLNAITEAKTALDKQPELQSRITDLERNLDKSMRHAQELELKLMERNDTIDNLQSKVRSLEVERDDMGFRELEAQDKLDALRNVVNTFTAKANSLVPQIVEVSQAEPISEAVPVANDSAPQAGTSTSQPIQVDDPRLPETPFNEVGESASPLPSLTTALMTESTGQAVGTVSGQNTVSTKPYEGKTYSQVFGSTSNAGVTIDNWQAGGGAHEDWWR